MANTWLGKPCAKCGAKKGRNQAVKKYCYRCGISERRESKERRHDAHIVATYGGESGDYAKQYAAQGGRCALCRRATGRSRRLAQDHDHVTGLKRGLLCSTCNQMLGHARDDPEFFVRSYWYLINKGYTP
jgi:hypothetical protein